MGWEDGQFCTKHYRDIRIILNNGAIWLLLLLNSKEEAYQSLQPFVHFDAELEELWLCV